MLTPCTKDEHVFTAWIIGTVCQCGATEVRLKPELGIVRAEPRAVAEPKPEVVDVHATDAAPVALEETAHEPEREPEAEQAFPPRRRR